MQWHLESQILPGIAVYETLQTVLPKEQALQTVHGYVEQRAWKQKKLFRALMHIPGFYKYIFFLTGFSYRLIGKAGPIRKKIVCRMMDRTPESFDRIVYKDATWRSWVNQDKCMIGQIGHAFGYYDYGIETGLVSLFSGRDDVAAYICGYVRAALQSGLLHTVGEGKEAFIAYKCPGERTSLRAVWPLLKAVCQSMNLSQMLRFVRLMQKAGPGTEDQFKNAKGELVFSTVLSVVSILLGLVPFYCMYRVICLFAAQTVTKQAVASWCGWALAAYAGKIVCFTLSTGISHHAAYNILEGLRLRLVERFLHAPLGEVQKHSIGEIKSILVDKIENIEPEVLHGICRRAASPHWWAPPAARSSASASPAPC